MKKIFIILLFFLLPNLFWQVLAFFFNIERNFFNIDYFLIILAIYYKRIYIGLLLFIFFSFFDFLNLFSQVFPFIRILDLFYLLKYSLLASYSNFLLLLLFLFFIYVYFVNLKAYIINIENKSLLIFFNILIIGFFVQNIWIKEDSRAWRIDAKRIISSQSIQTYELRNEGFLDNFNIQGDVFSEKKITSFSHNIFLSAETPRRILFIVNESWGVTNDEIQNYLIKDIKNNRNIISYKIGELKFDGFTLNGEIRELCQKNILHFNLKDQVTGFDQCLPNKLKNYHTVAMHGTTGAMYERKYWYPKVGFQRIYFRENFPNLKSRCYSFPGLCDQDLKFIVQQEFKNNSEIFFYWLTLNTHINYDLRDLKLDLFACEKFDINPNSPSCRNLKLQKQFFYHLNQLISTPEMKNTTIYVVGDHSPPLYGNEKTIFKKNTVATLVLKVR